MLHLSLHVFPYGPPRIDPDVLTVPMRKSERACPGPQLESRLGSADPNVGAYRWGGGGQVSAKRQHLDQSLHRLGREQMEMQSKGNHESTGMYCLPFQQGDGAGGGGRWKQV